PLVEDVRPDGPQNGSNDDRNRRHRRDERTVATTEEDGDSDQHEEDEREASCGGESTTLPEEPDDARVGIDDVTRVEGADVGVEVVSVLVHERRKPRQER